MVTFFYTIFLKLYVAGIRILSFWNPKSKLWIKGRKNFPVISGRSTPNTKTIWMHCASLGEFEQGRPVLENIKNQYAEVNVVLSFFSPSGYEVQKKYSGADTILYLPIDNKENAQKLVSVINPSLVLWVKYEYWFFYLEELKRQNIPLLLVSGIFRKSQPFFKWYGSTWRNALSCFTHFFIQDNYSQHLLADIGIDKNVTITGDTRFDRVIDIVKKFEHVPFIKEYCGEGRVIVAGSTWEEDEEELIHYVRANPQIKFIIAPHEINEDNLKDVQEEFAGSIFYSDLVKTPSLNSNVLIIDNVGMLSRLYHYADITYVGGGFGEDGVHNVLEAAVYGKPVIYGPEFEKFKEAIELIQCGGGFSICNALELEKMLTELWKNEQLLKDAGEAAKQYVYANYGASKKIMEYIQEKRLLIN